MPRTTRNSGHTASASAPTPSASTPTEKPRRRVSFAEEQGNAVAATAQTAAQRKKAEQRRKAEERARARAEKQHEQEEQAAAKRAEREAERQAARRRKEEEEAARRAERQAERLAAHQRKEEEERYKEMEKELYRLRRQKELYEADKERERQQDIDDREEERRRRMTTPDLLNETELLPDAYAHTPRTLQALKRIQADRESPHEYSLMACLKTQNGTRTITHWSNKIGGVWKQQQFNINVLKREIDDEMTNHNITEISDIRGWVRSSHHKGVRQYFSIKDLTIEEWESQIESVNSAQWSKYPKYVIDVSIDITGRKGLRRNIQAVDDPTSSPAHRRTRTTDLEERHTVVRDHNEALGDFGEKLITRWSCHDRICGHRGLCWINDQGEHKRLNTLQRERWASAIARGDATEKEPPYTVIKSFVEQAQESTTKKKSSGIEAMTEILIKKAEFEMAQSISTAASSSQQYQQHQQHHYLPQPSAPYPWSAYQNPYTLTPPPAQYPPPPTQHPSLTQNPPPPGVSQQRSSPIGERSEEEDILDAFWQWKKETTTREARKQQYCEIQRTVEREMWSIDDLKSMADTSSSVYKHAIDAGLPEGLIRNIRSDFKMFKQIWKTHLGGARDLLALGQDGGFH